MINFVNPSRLSNFQTKTTFIPGQQQLQQQPQANNIKIPLNLLHQYYQINYANLVKNGNPIFAKNTNTVHLAKSSLINHAKFGETMNIRNSTQDTNMVKKNFQNNQNSESLSKKATMNLLRMYEKQKFVAEYIRNNGDAATLIIPSFLFLGGHHSVKDADQLAKQGITHVLNMAQELNLDVHKLAANNIRVLSISAKDTRDYNIRSDFDTAFQFIDDCLKKKGKIIINCARGISRSATIVLGYLMFRYNMKLNDAYKLVVNLRPQVRPNSNFRCILETYDRELHFIRIKKQHILQSPTAQHIKIAQNV